MKEHEKKSIPIRLLNTVSAFALIGAAVYIFIVGFSLIPSLILLAAIGGLSGPVLVGGSEGILECLTGILESFVEGVAGVFSTIGDFFGSIFG